MKKLKQECTDRLKTKRQSLIKSGKKAAKAGKHVKAIKKYEKAIDLGGKLIGGN